MEIKSAMQAPVLGLVSSQVPSAQLVVTPRGMERPQPDFVIDVGSGVRRFFFKDPDGRIVNVLARV